MIFFIKKTMCCWRATPGILLDTTIAAFARVNRQGRLHMRVYRLKIATITAYRINNLVPELGDRRRELIEIVMREECFLSGRYPGVVFYFNRRKPNGALWRERNFKIVRLGSIARLNPEDAVYTYYERNSAVSRGLLNLGYTRLVTEADLCDAESCGELLAA